jgi:tRNA(fMet)-specific endonuclease VapC
MAVMDKRICLDTNMLIAYVKNREPGASLVEKIVRSYACYVTVITVYELLFGIARTRKSEIGEEALLDIMTVLPLTDAAARRAADLHAKLIFRNQDIGVKDVLIASICLEYDIPLITMNERHFSRVPGLKLIRAEDVNAVCNE